jgi:DNA-binding NarL/FixJ family response regulator
MQAPTVERIRIMLVDDHAIVRMGLRLLIEYCSEMLVVGEAGNRAEALAVAAREQPQIILLDLDLHGESSLDFLPELLDLAEGARVIVLTGLSDPEEHRRAVRLGAMGLVLKDQAAEVLIAAITKVHAGEVWLTPSMVASVLTELTHPPAARLPDPEAARLAALTTREREVVVLIGEQLKNRQIAARLSISEATVSHHLTSIFHKLNVTSRFELVLYAYRHGLARLPQ